MGREPSPPGLLRPPSSLGWGAFSAKIKKVPSKLGWWPPYTWRQTQALLRVRKHQAWGRQLSRVLPGLRGSTSGHTCTFCGKSPASTQSLVWVFAFPEGLMIQGDQSKARGD